MTTKKLQNKKMKMKGLMCQSRAATAVCTVGDPRSVIIPRKPHQEIKTKYSKLAESSSSSSVKFLSPPATSKSVLVSSIKKQESNNNNNNNNNKQEYYRAKLAMQKPSSVLQASSDHHHQVFQVVVMRVSLHCQGCAGKVKKHLSKMEGVTSFSIDLETKRVTVMGNVSPAGVLQSISKVKPAEFWPS